MVKRSTITSTLAGILISTASNIYSQNRSIEFEKDTIWENTLEKAKKEDKLIFVDAYTDWCGPCKWMEGYVFTDDSVADFYNKNFVNLKINTEKSIIGKELAKRYKIGLYPTLLFVDENGKMAHRKVGATETGDFITLGKEAMNLEERLSRFNEKYEQGERDGKFILDYVKKLRNARVNYDHVIEDYFQTQKKEDLTSKINMEIISIDMREEKLNSREFEHLLENSKKDSIDKEIFSSYLKNVERIMDPHSYETWKNKVKNSGFYRSREVLLEGSLIYNKHLKRWDEYAKDAITLVDSVGVDEPEKLYNIAWNFFDNIKNEKLLQKALEWSERSTKLKEDAHGYLTYGVLLYTLGRVDEAIKAEETALELSMETKNPFLIAKLKENVERMKNGERLNY